MCAAPTCYAEQHCSTQEARLLRNLRVNRFTGGKAGKVLRVQIHVKQDQLAVLGLTDSLEARLVRAPRIYNITGSKVVQHT